MEVEISQQQFDTEVLFPILADAFNIIFREHLHPPTLEEVEWRRWRDAFVLAYIPVANQLMPLAEVVCRRAAVGDELGLVVEPPVHLLKSMVTKFLWDLLETAERAGVRPFRDQRESAVEEGIRDVAERVAKLWAWTGFRQPDEV